MKRYIVFDGYVKSKNDGQMHYISARKVAVLYRVPFHECIFADRPEQLKGRKVDDYIKLTPRNDGDYRLK